MMIASLGVLGGLAVALAWRRDVAQAFHRLDSGSDYSVN